jgi:hypothetical protein
MLRAQAPALAQNNQGQNTQRPDDDRDRKVVTVAFGAGLNTAQPGNKENHHVLPNVIRVQAGDVVNFVVSGLHVIRVYDRGVLLSDVKAQIPDECEVNPTPPAEFPANFAGAEPRRSSLVPEAGPLSRDLRGARALQRQDVRDRRSRRPESDRRR